MTVSFVFNAPAARLSLNDRRHWANKARIARDWRDTTAVIAENHAILTKLARPLGPSNVHVEFVVATHRRRDADNAMSTVKPICDGLVDARWFTDDDSRTLRHSVGFTVDKAHAGQVRVTVTPWENAA
jgi:crossover junction endodeoxyribonuclease RusA